MTIQQISDFLVHHGFAPPDNQFAYWRPMQAATPLAWRYNQPPTPEELARELLDMTEFRTLQVGTWLGTADGEIITKAVEMVIPPYLRPDIELLVDGLKLAARLHQQRGQRIARGVALAVLVGFAFFAVNSRNS